MVCVAVAVVDGGQVAFIQADIVKLARLIQLESDVIGFNHLDGGSIEKAALGIPIFWILGLNFFIALDVGGHKIWTVVPHRFVIHGAHAVRSTQLVNHCLRDWEQARVGCNRVKVRFRVDAVVDDGMVIRDFDADHLQELGTFAGSQRIGFLFAQGLGVFIVLVCTLNHFQRHRGICRVIFVEVEHPLQTGSKVPCVAVSFLLRVDVYPFYSFAQVEGPGQTAVLCIPVLCNAGNRHTMRVNFQQTVPVVTEHIKLFLALRVQHIESFHLIDN